MANRYVAYTLEDEYIDDPDEFINYFEVLFENEEITLNELEQRVSEVPITNSDLDKLYQYMEEKEDFYTNSNMDEASRYWQAKIIIRKRMNLNHNRQR